MWKEEKNSFWSIYLVLIANVRISGSYRLFGSCKRFLRYTRFEKLRNVTLFEVVYIFTAKLLNWYKWNFIWSKLEPEALIWVTFITNLSNKENHLYTSNVIILFSKVLLIHRLNSILEVLNIIESRRHNSLCFKAIKATFVREAAGAKLKAK